MQAGPFDEAELFRAIIGSGARALLIGRRAVAALGIPVLTADYDFWLHIDDIEKFNAALATLELYPNRDAPAARAFGRYVVEGDERIDVLVARQVSTREGQPVRFDDVWLRRRTVRYDERLDLVMPCIDDLVLTKRWAMREKDVVDIQHLEALKRRDGGTK